MDEYCEGYRAETLTATGSAVQAQGWIVTSEAALGRYRVVSFASGFDPGTSGICTVRGGNIGVFDGERLVALAYAASGSETRPGSVQPMENGALLIWGGDYPAPPLGELHLAGDRPRLKAVADEQAFCRRTAVVPNVYGLPIQTARTSLAAHGWRPAPPEEAPGGYDGASALAAKGVVEAEACSGTGMGFCAFKYRGVAGTLDVTTTGGPDEADNAVVSYSVTCRKA